MRIKVHPGLCMGSGAGRQFASALYQLDDDGYLGLQQLVFGLALVIVAGLALART